MGENSKIEWTDHTFNPWIGCTKVSPGCDHCYAEGFANRFGTVAWGSGQPRHLTSDANWKKPLKWNHEAMLTGTQRRVFCASLADVFDNEVPSEWRLRLFDLIKATPHLDWLLLTKRISNAQKTVPFDAWQKSFPNVWLGASIINQEEADRDIPKLLSIPARIRFLSMEPLLGPVDLNRIECADHRHASALSRQFDGNYFEFDRLIDWVIVGGESGKNARPMHPDWVRSLRDQCTAAEIPFHFKQWGEWQNGSTFGANHDAAVLTDERVLEPTRESLGAADRASPVMRFNPTLMARVGKKTAGRLLDGREWNEFPSCIAA